MDDLLKKLNVLLKAALNDILSGSRILDSETGQSSTGWFGDEAHKQVAALRQRINETLTFEDEIQKRIQTLQAEVDRWNQAADDALASGNDALARHAVDQMNRAQQGLTMAQSDLHEHQKVTEELISHVNALEAAVESSRQAHPDAVRASTEPPFASIGQAISSTLQEMRDKINQFSDQITSRSELSSDMSKEILDQPADDHKIDDDLEERRQRLSKPK